MRLQYFVPRELGTEVVATNGGPVAVPEARLLPVGSRVSLEVEAPELLEPLAVTGVVQPGGRVLLDAVSVEQCRRALAARDVATRTVGRSELRVDCDLPARVVHPHPVAGCAVKTLSPHGVTLRTPRSLLAGSGAEVAFTLPDGGEVVVRGQVAWTRPELSLAGVHLGPLAAETASRLDAAMRALAGAPGPRAAKKHLVLVADRDSAILDVVSRVVEKVGHEVAQARTGDEALEVVRAEGPALVFVDAWLSASDGRPVCQHLRLDAALARIPLVVMSAMAPEKLKAIAVEVDARHHLTKPVRIDAIRLVLAEQLPR